MGIQSWINISKSGNNTMMITQQEQLQTYPGSINLIIMDQWINMAIMTLAQHVQVYPGSTQCCSCWTNTENYIQDQNMQIYIQDGQCDAVDSGATLTVYQYSTLR